MGALPNWQCFLGCSDAATAAPVAWYLELHDCPAFVFPLSPSCDLAPAAVVLVPREFLEHARHIWTHTDILGDLTDGELEYLATGKLPGAAAADAHQQDDAA